MKNILITTLLALTFCLPTFAQKVHRPSPPTAVPTMTYVRITTENTTYNLPANPVEGDIILLTFDTDGYCNNAVDAGTNYLDVLGFSPFNVNHQGSSGSIHAFRHVYSGHLSMFYFTHVIVGNTVLGVWASNLHYDIDAPICS